MLLHSNLSKLSIRGCFPPLPHGYFSKTLNLDSKSFFTESRVLFTSGLGGVALSKGGIPHAGKAAAISWTEANEQKDRVTSEIKDKRSSSWDRSADKFFTRTGEKSTDKSVNASKDTRFSSRDRFKRQERHHKEEEDEFMDDSVDNPRRYNIRDKYKPFVKRDTPNSKFKRTEVKQWERQDNWGKKTWKDPSESTVPKMVGQGVYGVGPVLAALTANRREFHALYIQENMDLSANNKKKKDKKGIQKVIQTANKIGLKVVETAKHDLNMVVENRPHQGLVLDASPLEMVGIKELEPISLEQGQKAPIWVALDEVMDPQNLGAIIRSAYYFGANGVVLCAKNSAPLTGVVSKASAGSLELVELRSCKNMMQFLSGSADNGWRVLGGSVSDEAVSITEIGGNVPTVLVLGSEGTGLRPLVERSCTGLVRIPGFSDIRSGFGAEEESETHSESFLAVESLNVSVAAGVMLYHLISRHD
ncbi:tRNA/rRNA methyltransferase (SpoU) family protein [Carex rostrata]